jgi:hypothetical protein
VDKLFRVRPAWQGGTAAVLHPDHGMHVVPDVRATFAESDPLVREYPWLFVPVEADATAPEPPNAVRIEDASARPGARRGVRR